jgi:hypothetical protein
LVVEIIGVGLPAAAGPNSGLYDALNLAKPVTYPLKGFAYTCSIYLLILLTFERYIVLCHSLDRIEDIKAWVGFIYTIPASLA